DARQQLGGADAGEFVSGEKMLGGRIASEVLRELVNPVSVLLRRIAVGVPGVASPRLVPDPVAIHLVQARSGVIRGVGPVPVAQRVEVQAFDTDADEVRLGLADKVRIAPAKG